jgi:guanine deaminase
VLDLRSTPLIDFRMKQASDLAEQLFIQMTLGDDRAVRATYIGGRAAYERGSAPSVKFGWRAINMVAGPSQSGYASSGS